MQAIEQIDEHIVGPLLKALEGMGEYRILIEPDHRTLVRTKAHTHGPVPFALAGKGIHPPAKLVAGYHESAVPTDFKIQVGHLLLAHQMIAKG